MYDAIVVGARCAGSPTAMLLARRGYRVLLVDRATFPSDTLSVHYIHQPGVARLAGWGLLDRVAQTGCPPVAEQSLDFGPVVLRGAPPPVDGISVGFAPRRTVLDKILVDAAVESGAEIREQFTVEGLLQDGDQVVGIRGHDRGGKTVEERAKIVIGADGRHSLVAKRTGTATYNERPAQTCAYYTYISGVSLERVELSIRENQTLVLGPTNDDQILAIHYWPASAFNQVRKDVEGHFGRAVDSIPAARERLRDAVRTEPYRGALNLPAWYRKPYGPGWALVGDAGFHKDPITAQGISDAFRDADFLAASIDAGFSGRQPLEQAMQEYENTRNEGTAALYQMTADLASLAPPSPQQQAIIGALPGNQEQINRFIGTVAGTYPIPAFFSPENLEQLLGQPALA